MQITWENSLREVADLIGQGERSWLVDAFDEAGADLSLEGRRIGDVPTAGGWATAHPPRGGLTALSDSGQSRNQ